MFSIEFQVIINTDNELCVYGYRDRITILPESNESYMTELKSIVRIPVVYYASWEFLLHFFT